MRSKYLSEELQPGFVYTRQILKEILATNDATINTGIFHPKGFSSVLLFVTERKTPDRYQYVDFLDSDELQWEGQAKRGKDNLIIEHRARGLELLLFYRADRHQHPHSGFTYEGSFQYESHLSPPSGPTRFLLHRQGAQVPPKSKLIRESSTEATATLPEQSAIDAHIPSATRSSRHVARPR